MRHKFHLIIYFQRLGRDVADAQNRHLRRVEHGRKHLHAKGPQVGDGEGAAGHLVGQRLARLGRRRQPLGLDGQGAQAERVGIAHDRHQQPARRIDGNTQVHMLVLANRVAGEQGIERRELRQRARHGQQHQVVDGDAAQAQCLVARLEPRPQRLQGAGVGGGVHGQLRRRLQRLQHTFGDHLAHALDGDDFDLVGGMRG